MTAAIKFALIIAVGISLLAAAGSAQAQKPHAPPPFRVIRTYVRSRDGVRHQVTMVTFMPGHKMRFRVTASSTHRLRTPLSWGNRAGAYATMNADTWAWTTGVPTGITEANGRGIVWPPYDHEIWNRPAVGFYSSGGVVWGANEARLKGAADIVGQVAMLIRGGKVLPRASYVWAHRAQAECGARGTDGRGGCWRSCVARWASGRVGLVEIGFASMRQAASVLHRLHVVEASTGDSGGSSVLGWRHGRSRPWAQAGVQHALHSGYLRAVPDAIVMVQR
jgi:hypothetical protein